MIRWIDVVGHGIMVVLGLLVLEPELMLIIVAMDRHTNLGLGLRHQIALLTVLRTEITLILM